MSIIVEKVFGSLSRRGFSRMEEIRNVGECLWLKARKDDKIWELEVYSDLYYQDGKLQQYLNSFVDLPIECPFMHIPVTHFTANGYTYIVRVFRKTRPLLDLLMRPGSVSEKDALNILKSLETIISYLSKYEMKSFAPLAVSLSLTDDGELYLRSYRNGPWLKYVREVTIVYSYLNLDLPWQQQLCYFRNKLTVKLFCGETVDVTLLSPNTRRFVETAIKDKEGFNARLDDYSPITKEGKMSVSLFCFPILLLISLVGLIIWFSSVQKVNWEGPLYSKALPEVVPVVNDLKNELHENEVISQFSFQYNSMLFDLESGQFLELNRTLRRLRSEELTTSERKQLDSFEKALPEKKRQFLTRIRNVLGTMSYEQKKRALIAILQNCPEGSLEKLEVSALMSELIEQHRDKVNESRLQKRQQSLLESRDRNLILQAERYVKQPLNRPIDDLNLLNEKLVKLEKDMGSQLALKLSSIYRQMIQAELYLYQRLNSMDELEKSQVFNNLTKEKRGLVDTELLAIDKVGFDYKHKAGGSFLKFRDLSSQEIYRVFSFQIDNEGNDYLINLYLFCLKYDLKSQQKAILSRLSDKHMIDSLKELSQFRKIRHEMFDLGE